MTMRSLAAERLEADHVDVAVLFLAAGALPTRHDRFGLSTDEVVARRIELA